MMDYFKKINSQNEERDKLLKLIQYSIRLWWSCKEKCSDNPGGIEQLKNAERSIVTSRQSLNFGNFIHVLNSSFNFMHLQDNIFRTTLSLSHISQSLYLLCDNLIWLSKIGIINIDEKRFNKLADLYLLYSKILLLIKNLYQMQLVLKSDMISMQEYSERKSFWQVSNFFQSNKALSTEIVNNLCDICLLLDTLNRVNISSFKIGIIGLISALIPFLKYKNVVY